MNVNIPSMNDIGVNYVIRLSESKALVSRDKEDFPGELSLQDGEKEMLTQESSTQNKEAQENLTPDERRVVNELEARDREVKAHEAAHQAAGGGMTGAASYTYQIGPDGKMYAIGGEVSINTPTPSSPEEAIKIARQVATAAMAASEPSPQDYAVAASARMMEIQAEQELAKEKLEKQRGLESYKNELSAFSPPADQTPQDEAPRLDISA